MVPYSAQFMKRLGIQATFGKSLKDICCIVSQPFIKCNIKFSKGMSNIVKEFNYSSHLCVTVLAKSHLVGFLESLAYKIASLLAKPKPWAKFWKSTNPGYICLSLPNMDCYPVEITLKGLTYNVFSLVRIYHSKSV